MAKIGVETDTWWDYKVYRGEITKKVKTRIGDFTVWLGGPILLVLRVKYLSLANKRSAKWDFTI